MVPAVHPIIPQHRLRLAAHWIARGGLVVYPTEAVYGLGCHPQDEEAVQRVIRCKARPPQKGLILIAADWQQLLPFVEPLSAAQMQPLFASWPGPHTWLLPARPEVSRWLRGDHETLAVRITAHPLASALCRASGTALVSTSANRTGRPPARTALQVRRRLSGWDYLLAGSCGGRDRCSSIRDGRTGELLRP